MDGPIRGHYYPADRSRRMVVEEQVCRSATARDNRRPCMAWNIAGAGLYRACSVAVASVPEKCCSYFALSGIRRRRCARTHLSGKPGWSNGFWAVTTSAEGYGGDLNDDCPYEDSKSISVKA